MLTFQDIQNMYNNRLYNKNPIICIAKEDINNLMSRFDIKSGAYNYYSILAEVITNTRITSPLKYCSKFIKHFFKADKNSNGEKIWWPNYEDAGFVIPAVIYQGVFYVHECVETISDGENFLDVRFPATKQIIKVK